MRIQANQLKPTSAIDRGVCHIASATAAMPTAIRYFGCTDSMSCPATGIISSMATPPGISARPESIRGVVEARLQQLRQDLRAAEQHDADRQHHQERSAELTLKQQPDVDDRILARQFPGDEQRPARTPICRRR